MPRKLQLAEKEGSLTRLRESGSFTHSNGMTIAFQRSRCAFVPDGASLRGENIMRWLAIINPNADHHRTDELRTLDRHLRSVGACCSWTEYENHGRDMVRNGHYEGYIAVGGDGTILEVVNGMAGNDCCLGIVPAGTGNGRPETCFWRTKPRPCASWSTPISLQWTLSSSVFVGTETGRSGG